MASSNPQFMGAEDYLRDAVTILKAAQQKHLDHSDTTAVTASLEGIEAVLRCLAGTAALDCNKVVARLDQIAGNIKACAKPNARIASQYIGAASQMLRSATPMA